jgi:pilus assembly protein Flp/PilA
MNTKIQVIRRLLKNLNADQAGATAIEYGLIAALLGVALVTAMQGLGTSIGNTFNTVNNKMVNVNTTTSA